MTVGAQLTSTQKGKVTEQLVAATLILASNGRLSPFVPLSDDHGIDLMVLDKDTHKTLTIQVKSAIASPSRGTVQFDIRKATHSGAAGRYLLAVLFDPARASIATSWLIPMARVAEVSVAQADKYALSPSTAAGSRDRYRPFRHDDPQSLIAAVLQALANPAASLP